MNRRKHTVSAPMMHSGQWPEPCSDSAVTATGLEFGRNVHIYIIPARDYYSTTKLRAFSSQNTNCVAAIRSRIHNTTIQHRIHRIHPTWSLQKYITLPEYIGWPSSSYGTASWCIYRQMCLLPMTYYVSRHHKEVYGVILRYLKPNETSNYLAR